MNIINKNKSITSIKDAIGGEEFARNMDVLVKNKGKTYFYNNIYVRVSYNVSFMQMNIDIVWEDDSTQIYYKKLGLHSKYNTQFQEFSFQEGKLRWSDGNNDISIMF